MNQVPNVNLPNLNEKECPDCHNMVQDTEATCPNCGHDFNQVAASGSNGNSRRLLWIIPLILVLCICGAVSLLYGQRAYNWVMQQEFVTAIGNDESSVDLDLGANEEPTETAYPAPDVAAKEDTAAVHGWKPGDQATVPNQACGLVTFEIPADAQYGSTFTYDPGGDCEETYKFVSIYE
ncbi:MAG: hypothetical protein ACOZAO_00260 [Patescibacteria group bacterium]